MYSLFAASSGLVALVLHLGFGFVCLLAATLDPVDQHLVLFAFAVFVPYAGMIVVWLEKDRLFRGRASRRVYHAWLLACLLAALLASLCLYFNWPLSLRGWDGHGMGASGAEANAVLFPWLHVLLWIVLGRVGQGRRE